MPPVAAFCVGCETNNGESGGRIEEKEPLGPEFGVVDERFVIDGTVDVCRSGLARGGSSKLDEERARFPDFLIGDAPYSPLKGRGVRVRLQGTLVFLWRADKPGFST